MFNLISLVIHGLLVLVITFSNSGNGTGNGGDASDTQAEEAGNEQSVDVNVLERDQPTPIQEKEEEPELIISEELTEAEAALKQARDKYVEENCPNLWYGGIGVQTTNNNEVGATILAVYRGYAAELAGLQVGDLIVSKDTATILGEPGTSFNMVIERNNQLINVRLIRVKVCY